MLKVESAVFIKLSKQKEVTYADVVDNRLRKAIIPNWMKNWEILIEKVETK